MSAIESRIKELVSFARNRDGEDRTVLFGNLIELFLSGKAPAKSPTRVQLLEVIQALIPHVEADTRRDVSERVAAMQDPPLDLALTLARDRANIAAGLLVHAPFTEDDLIELIGGTGRDHHQLISSRTDLSANVWIALARATPGNPPGPASTLDLWRDGLGVDGAKDTPPTSQAARPEARPDTDRRAQARLRILRLDEDIIATKAEESGLGIGDGFEADPPEQEPTISPPRHQAPSVSQSRSTASTQPLTDPGPGGWAWRSDRDGFVAALSPAAPAILGKPEGRLKGQPMLDMLGLNAKLGHPIARALQRRSAIHDAPLYLPQLDKLHRYWTLDANPVFNEHSGVFEGYEGNLTPVRADAGDSQDDSSEDMLFLPEKQAARTDITGPAPVIDPAPENTAFQTMPQHRPAPGQPATVQTNAHPPMGPQTTAPQVYAETAIEAASETANDAPFGLDALSGVVSDSTAALVRSVIADAFAAPEHGSVDQGAASETLNSTDHKGAEPQTTRAPDIGEAQSAPPANSRAHGEPASPAPFLPAPLEAPQSEESLERTLQLLDQALEQLVRDGKASNNMSMRLQAEIAAACVRVLKDHLGLAPKA